MGLLLCVFGLFYLIHTHVVLNTTVFTGSLCYYFFWVILNSDWTGKRREYWNAEMGTPLLPFQYLTYLSDHPLSNYHHFEPSKVAISGMHCHKYKEVECSVQNVLCDQPEIFFQNHIMALLNY